MKINHETKKNPVIIALLIATGMLSGKKKTFLHSRQVEAEN